MNRSLAILSFAVVVPALDAQAPIPKLTTVTSLMENDWIADVAESPNGRFFVARHGREVRIYDTGGNIIGRLSNADGFDLSPSGTALAIARQAEGQKQWVDHIWTVAIDSASGRITGEPRRVSIQTGAFPAFSPDARSIAYVRRDSATSSIVVIPAIGGEERVAAKLRGEIRFLRWSPDGNHFYYARAQGPPQIARVERLPVRGGAPDSLAAGSFLLGFSSDERHFAMYPHPFIPWRGDYPEISIHTLDGREVGRFAPAKHTRSPSWSRRQPNVMVGAHMTVPIALKHVSLPDGTIRALPEKTGFDRKPQLTADGKRLVFQGLVDGKYQFFLSDPDGGKARQLATKASPEVFLISPNGKSVVFASDINRRLHLLDVSSEAERQLPVRDFGMFAWRSDSKAIRYVDMSQSPAKRVIREQPLDGSGSVLLRIDSPEYLAHSIHFLDDTLGVAMGRNDVFSFHLPSGRAIKLYDGRAGWTMGWIVQSRDKQFIGFGVNDDKSGLARGYMVSLDGKQQRSVGQGFRCDANITAFLPDPRHVLLRGYPRCESDGGHEEIYLAPLNGGPMRHLSAADTASDINNVYLAPDGRRAYYESERPYRAAIVRFEIPHPDPR